MESNDILHYRGHLYVPKQIILMILESEYDRKVADHFRLEKTIELVRRNFWWPAMDTNIMDYL